MKKILLFGNANVGKTTIYNIITNGNERVGNYEGVTVGLKKKYVEDLDAELIDLPGVNLLAKGSFVDNLTLDTVIENDFEKTIVVVDVNNIRRNLYIAIEALEMHKDSLLIINKIDKFKGELNENIFSEKNNNLTLEFGVSYLDSSNNVIVSDYTIQITEGKASYNCSGITYW